MSKWVITGANGNLGRRLINKLSQTDNDIVAVVRSESARKSVDETAKGKSNVSCEVVDYANVEQLTASLGGAEVVVHLVGILKATASATYEQAHERSCEALVEACKVAGVRQIIYMSIVGSQPNANNSCLASKGTAEEILLNSGVQVCVLQVPMVLGEGDYASWALKSRALKSFSFGFRMASLEQPIYAGDVVEAVQNAAVKEVHGRLQLAGETVLTRAELTQRAAMALNKSTTVISLPITIGYAIAWLLQQLSKNPPITMAMLEVLDHDDHVDPQPAANQLDIKLTPLDDMLKNVLT